MRMCTDAKNASSSSRSNYTSFDEYLARAKTNQSDIYYISGEDKESLLKSPSVEKLLSKVVATARG